MRKGQFIAMLLSAVLTVSSVVPLSVLEAAAAESTESGITVETEQEEEIPPEAADVAEQAQEGDTEPEAAEPEESAPEEPAEGEPEETVPEEPAEGEQEEQPAEAAEDDSAEEAETAGETSEESMQDTDTQEETGTIEEEPDAEISGTGVTEPAVVETEESQTGATANEAAADNHFKAYLKGFADTYDTIDINLGPGEERQLQVIAEADDYSGMTYTWKKNDEKIREITAEEIIRQNGEPSSDTITVTGDEKARYEVEVSDGISDPVRISFYVSVNNEFWAYPDGAKMRDNSIPDSSTELYARTGEEVTLNVCVHAVDKNRITYKWYDGNYDEIEGESSGSLIVTAGNESMSFMCIVNDGYGNSCDVDFYISPLNTFSAYPEGAAMDEFGNIADTAQISADLGEKITLRVVTKAQEGIELSYHWADSEGNVLKD